MLGSAPQQFWRLFVSIPIPETIKATLQAAQQELREALTSSARKAIRWTSPAQFHLTLLFLGDFEAQRVPELTEALRNACREYPPLHLQAQRAGFFPERGSPRILWVGIQDGCDQLIPLQRQIETAVRGLSVPSEEREFKGHLTLGRIQGLRAAEAQTLSELALKKSGSVFGAWVADRVHLMRSELLPQGAKHSTIADFHLETGGGRVKTI